jgi:hypothetical protein
MQQPKKLGNGSGPQNIKILERPPKEQYQSKLLTSMTVNKLI